MVDWFAFIIALLAFMLSCFQFLRDASRQKKESTLNAYNELQTSVFDMLNTGKYDKISEIEFESPEWKNITGCLAKIERFSVGINSEIYSIDILNRLGGSYYIFKYYELKPIIDKKKEVNEVKGKHYDEFELTVKRLEEYRECKNFIEKSLKRMKWIINNYKLD